MKNWVWKARSLRVRIILMMIVFLFVTAIVDWLFCHQAILFSCPTFN